MIVNILFAICIIATMTFGILAFRERNRDHSTNYQQINAKIIRMSIRDQDVNDGYTRVGNVSIVRRHKIYQMWPTYQYDVGGTAYLGEFMANTFNSSEMAQLEYSNIMANPARQQVVVYYDKTNPSKSMLTFDKNNNTKYYLVGMFLSMFVAVMVKLPYGRMSSRGAYNNNNRGAYNNNRGYNYYNNPQIVVTEYN